MTELSDQVRHLEECLDKAEAERDEAERKLARCRWAFLVDVFAGQCITADRMDRLRGIAFSHETSGQPPTVDDFARHYNRSPRVIQRDLALLREHGLID